MLAAEAKQKPKALMEETPSFKTGEMGYRKRGETSHCSSLYLVPDADIVVGTACQHQGASGSHNVSGRSEERKGDQDSNFIKLFRLTTGLTFKMSTRGSKECAKDFDNPTIR